MSKTKKPLVKLNDVTMNFYKGSSLFGSRKAFNALHNIDFEIAEGEVVVVVGESGSGKTTMANIIANLLEPTQGTYEFDGMDLKKMSKAQYTEYRNNIQMIQQDSYAALNPVRTMIKNLGDPLVIKKYANKKNVYEKVCEALKTVELSPPENFIHKYSHQLSGGQRQRSLIARAISMEPKLMLADEPVSMIDVSLRVAILNLIAKLNQERNIAIMYITHDLATARYVGKDGRIAVMYLGEIVETGNVQDVLADPKHPYLRALVSAVPIPNPRIAKRVSETNLADVDLPDTSNMPSGCRFHTRCPFAKDICRNEAPKPVQSGASLVKCHLVEEIPPYQFIKE